MLKAADQGLDLAQITMAMDSAKNDRPAEILRWVTKAANQESPFAQMWLGVLYRRGEGVSPDSEKALEWFKKAAAHGFSDAMFVIGQICEEGKNINDAAKWYTSAENKGHDKAKEALARLSTAAAIRSDDTATSGRRDSRWASSFETLKDEAVKGNPNAQYNLASAYEDGRGVQRDLHEAMMWYGEALSNGAAMWHIALERLQRFAETDEKGAAIYQQAISKWSAGFAFKGSPRDQLAALKEVQRNHHVVEMIQQKARDGDRDSGLLLKRLAFLDNPDPTKISLERLVELGEAGEADAFYWIGRKYEDGLGVSKDYREAERWYVKAHNGGAKFAHVALERIRQKSSR